MPITTGNVPKAIQGSDRMTLSAAQRRSMPSSQFALPGKGEGAGGKGAGAYPINDASHARNALARVAQHGSPEEKAAVKRKVAEKYPSIGHHNDGGQAFPDNPNAFGPAMAPNRGMPGKSAPPIGVEFKPFPRGPMVAGEGPASAPARPMPLPTSE